MKSLNPLNIKGLRLFFISPPYELFVICSLFFKKGPLPPVWGTVLFSCLFSDGKKVCYGFTCLCLGLCEGVGVKI